MKSQFALSTILCGLISACAPSSYPALTGFPDIDQHLARKHFTRIHIAVAPPFINTIRCSSRGEYKEALEWADKLVKMQSRCAWGHAYKAYLLVKLSRPKEAIEEADKAIKEDPTFDVCHAAKALALYSLAIEDGNADLLKDSIDEYQEALDHVQHPDARESYYAGQARCYLKLNDLDSAWKILKPAWGAPPESCETHELRAEYFKRTGQTKRFEEEKLLAKKATKNLYYGPDWHQME